MVPRIRQIQIRNYKSIDRAVVDLEPFTVLVGANGTGKSNFVDALAFVQECLTRSIEEAFRNHGGITLFPRWLPLAGEYSLGFGLKVDLSEASEAYYSFEISWKAREGYRVKQERCRLRTRNQDESAFEIASGNFVREISGIRSQIPPDRLALFAASATEEFRPVYDFLTSIRTYSIKPFFMAGNRGLGGGESLDPAGRNAAVIFREIQERDPVLSERISRIVARAIQGVRQIGTRVERQEVSLEFKKDMGLEEPAVFHAFEMSEGTLRLLGLLLAIYQPKRPTVLVVEEPEATIHPAAAELVTQVLMDAAHDRQVLVTTHSPDILDAKELSDDQIRVVAMERGRTVIAPLSKASRQAIRERLYTPGELLRLNELDEDVEAAKRAAEDLDLFGPLPS